MLISKANTAWDSLTMCPVLDIKWIVRHYSFMWANVIILGLKTMKLGYPELS